MSLVQSGVLRSHQRHQTAWNYCRLVAGSMWPNGQCEMIDWCDRGSASSDLPHLFSLCERKALFSLSHHRLPLQGYPHARVQQSWYSYCSFVAILVMETTVWKILRLQVTWMSSAADQIVFYWTKLRCMHRWVLSNTLWEWHTLCHLGNFDKTHLLFSKRSSEIKRLQKIRLLEL